MDEMLINTSIDFNHLSKDIKKFFEYFEFCYRKVSSRGNESLEGISS